MSQPLNSSIEQLHNSLSQVDLTTFDVGNSHIKKSFFSNGKINEPEKVDESEIQKKRAHPAIICSVRKEIKSSFSRKGDAFLEAPIQYEPSLGHDRLVSVAHLFHIQRYCNSPIILIDCGTFITADFVNPCGHVGGFIFPGAEVFLNSYKSGQLLPRIANRQQFDPSQKWPTQTEQAIRGAAELYLEGLAKQFEDRAIETGSKLLLTGGASHLISNYFENRTPYEVSANLLHYSLYFTHCKIANL